MDIWLPGSSAETVRLGRGQQRDGIYWVVCWYKFCLLWLIDLFEIPYLHVAFDLLAFDDIPRTPFYRLLTLAGLRIATR